jgi:predicted TIM-barrel fold metal-dependent hydrolase
VTAIAMVSTQMAMPSAWLLLTPLSAVGYSEPNACLVSVNPADDNGSLQLVDAHVHLWHLSAHRWYPAMQDPEIARTWATLGDISRMARDFLIEDYRAETHGYDVVGLVHVSATTSPRAYLDEARWIDGLLDSADVPAAVIGTVEPTLAAEELEADLGARDSGACAC